MSAPMSFEEWRNEQSFCQPLENCDLESAFDAGHCEGQASRQPEIAALKAELERERICHAACGVVAMSNTDDALAKVMDMSPEYLSAAIRDVARAVRAEIDLRKENEALKARIAELEQENFRLAAGRCVHPNGIIGSDGGTPLCPITETPAAAMKGQS